MASATTIPGDLQNPTTRGVDDSFAIRIFQLASSLSIFVFLALLVSSERVALDGRWSQIALWAAVALAADLMLVRVGKGVTLHHVFASLPCSGPSLPSGFCGNRRFRGLLRSNGGPRRVFILKSCLQPVPGCACHYRGRTRLPPWERQCRGVARCRPMVVDGSCGRLCSKCSLCGADDSSTRPGVASHGRAALVRVSSRRQHDSLRLDGLSRPADRRDFPRRGWVGSALLPRSAWVGQRRPRSSGKAS